MKIYSRLSTITTIFLTLFLISCGGTKLDIYEEYRNRVSTVGDLTDEMVVKYAKTYKNLRNFGIRFEDYLAKNPDASGTATYNEMEKIIKEGGFKDFEEFVKVNAKIAWAWNLSMADRGIKDFDRMQEWGDKKTDEGVAQIEEALKNPELPAESREELKKAKETLLQARKDRNTDYKKNKKWAEVAMKLTKPLTNEKDMAVIMRHERELMEVFTGLSPEQLDAIQDASLEYLKH